MLKKLISICLVVVGFTTTITLQAADKEIGIHDKGSFYSFWGWNRGYFAESNVTFKGDNYDFTIKDMSASDRPSAIGIHPYLNPLAITIPQTNFHFGYFFKDNYAVAFGIDHMKYIMDQEQTAIIDGYINVGSEHDGEYDNQAVYLGQRGEPDPLREDEDELGDLTFLAYEHSDGLNYINLEVSRFDDLYYGSPSFRVSSIVGGGLGFMLPRTNATLLENERHDQFHLAGWGTHVKGGVELSYNKLFFRTELKLGYIDMPDIRTTEFTADSAYQDIEFMEWVFVFGSYF